MTVINLSEEASREVAVGNEEEQAKLKEEIAHLVQIRMTLKKKLWALQVNIYEHC